MKLAVESYSGYKGDERPLRFRMRERVFEISEVLDRWYGPGDTWFRVRADDGNLYILRNTPDGGWTLESFRIERQY